MNDALFWMRTLSPLECYFLGVLIICAFVLAPLFWGQFVKVGKGRNDDEDDDDTYNSAVRMGDELLEKANRYKLLLSFLYHFNSKRIGEYSDPDDNVMLYVAWQKTVNEPFQTPIQEEYL